MAMGVQKITSRLGLALMAVLVVGCASTCQKTRDDLTPEEVVEQYLELVFNMERIDQKNDLLELSTGSLRAALAGATDDTIQEAYIRERYQLQRFSVVERRDRTPREVEVTYEIVYREKEEGNADFQMANTVQTENTVSVIRENRRWYIRAVLGSKTTIEFPLEAASQISPSP